MHYSRQSDKRVYVDDTVTFEEEVPNNLPVALENKHQEIMLYAASSPWRKDLRFALQLLGVMLALNIGLYFAFHLPDQEARQRLALTNELSGPTDDGMALEERVLTYSTLPLQHQTPMSDQDLGNLAPAAGTVELPSSRVTFTGSPQ